MNIPKFLQSSADAEKLSLTVKGVASSIIPIALLLANSYGASLTAELLNGALDSILNILIVVSSVVSAVVTAKGAVRKVINSLKK